MEVNSMSRARLTVLAGIVAAFVMAVGAASASAEITLPDWVINGVKLLSGHVKFKHKTYPGNFLLLGTPFGVAIHIKCTSVLVLGGLLPEGLGFVELAFKTCTVVKPLNCTVKEPINVNADFHHFHNTVTGKLYLIFKPLGGAFAKITLEGPNCAFKELFEVTGEQECNLPGIEAEATGHTVECLKTESKLTAGGKPATFEGSIEGLELEESQKWSG
jgi:hypothetical protein